MTIKTTTSVTIETVGRRHYLRGNTYPIKDRLRNAGAHWDPEQRAWWTAKREVAEGAIGAADTAIEQRNERERTEGVDKSAAVIRGKAAYKGKTYLLLWSGETKRGPAAKLCFRDGSKVFWADGPEVQIIKTYREPLSIAKLDRLAEEYRYQREHDGERRPGTRYECEECGDWVTAGEGSCWETGMAH